MNKKTLDISLRGLKVVVLQVLHEKHGAFPTPCDILMELGICLLYTSPSPRDRTRSRMPSSA